MAHGSVHGSAGFSAAMALAYFNSYYFCRSVCPTRVTRREIASLLVALRDRVAGVALTRSRVFCICSVAARSPRSLGCRNR